MSFIIKNTGDYSPDYETIGKPLPRHDAIAKVFGETVYANDYKIPGMLHVKALRSQYAAARLLSIGTSAAKSLPGVAAVLTAEDVPNNETVTRFGQTTEVGGFEGLYRVLASGKIRFKGEAVAIVAAETLETAEEALKLIKVDYEPLEGVFDPVEAMKTGAYLVGEDDSNVICSYKVRKGDVEEGFAKAEVIVENTFRVPPVDHAYLEPEAGVAWLDEEGTIVIRASTQVIEHFRGIAGVLGVPHNKIRVIAPMVGGGFGGKEDITVETYLALVVQKTGRPASMVWTREESIICHSKRHPYVMRYKTGAAKDGKLVALEAELISDAGAYTYLSPWVLLYSTVNATGPYDIDHVRVDSHTVLTNNTFSSANRGFGANQPCFAYELQLDELAEKLGMSPLEIRRKNYLHQGGKLATGRVLENAVETEASAVAAMEALGEPTKPRHARERIGQGLASCMSSYGRMMFLHDTSRSYVSVELDGSVIVRCGVQDIGGGQCASLASIAAETLGVSLEDVRVFYGDSAMTPLAGTTTATRQLYMSGNATYKAAKVVRDNLLGKAAEMLDAPVELLMPKDRKIIFKPEAQAENPDRSLDLIQVIKACAADGVPLLTVEQFNAPARDLLDFKTGQGQVFPDFTFGSIAIEAAVDLDTGKTEVLKMVTCFDAGQAINPLSATGQLEGGAVYGLGYGKMEEVVLEKGQTLNPNLESYLLPTSLDAPDIQAIMLQSGGGVGPFGAKGLGEPSCVPTAPAFVNAVCNAIGKRMHQIPATPERILQTLGSI